MYLYKPKQAHRQLKLSAIPRIFITVNQQRANLILEKNCNLFLDFDTNDLGVDAVNFVPGSRDDFLDNYHASEENYLSNLVIAISIFNVLVLIVMTYIFIRRRNLFKRNLSDQSRRMSDYERLC